LTYGGCGGLHHALFGHVALLLQLGELLAKRGWIYGYLIKPAALHFCFTMQHATGVAAQKADLAAACAELRESMKKQKANGKASPVSDKVKLYGMAGSTFGVDSIADVLLSYQDAMLEP
jgi:hypothetical protein